MLRTNKQVVTVLGSYLRPAIVEAKLMTDKHACDEIYVATLAEELRTIETKIALSEKLLGIEAEQRPCRAYENPSQAAWIREKSVELDRRLRRVERTNRAVAGSSSAPNTKG
jgi:hypothetical protein